MDYVIVQYDTSGYYVLNYFGYHNTENAKQKFYSLVHETVSADKHLAKTAFEKFGQDIDKFAEYCWNLGNCSKNIYVYTIKWED